MRSQFATGERRESYRQRQMTAGIFRENGLSTRTEGMSEHEWIDIGQPERTLRWCPCCAAIQERREGKEWPPASEGCPRTTNYAKRVHESASGLPEPPEKT